MHLLSARLIPGGIPADHVQPVFYREVSEPRRPDQLPSLLGRQIFRHRRGQPVHGLQHWKLPDGDWQLGVPALPGWPVPERLRGQPVQRLHCWVVHIGCREERVFPVRTGPIPEHAPENNLRRLRLRAILLQPGTDGMPALSRRDVLAVHGRRQVRSVLSRRVRGYNRIHELQAVPHWQVPDRPLRDYLPILRRGAVPSEHEVDGVHWLRDGQVPDG